MTTTTATTTARSPLTTGIRRRSSTGSSTASFPPGNTTATMNLHNTLNNTPGSPSLPAMHHRRNSSLSEYSQEARDLINPVPPNIIEAEAQQRPPRSRWDSLPLAFAILPAIGGLFVQGGSAFVTDLMLLGLGAIFLHWSVTQPWAWYYSAQQVRKDQQERVEYAYDSDADSVQEDNDEALPNTGSLANVPEEEEDNEGSQDGEPKKPRVSRKEKDEDEQSKEASPERQRSRSRSHRVQKFRKEQDSALRELYRHEILALMSCFAAPALGAFLLQAIRDQLTRPSEGLVSGYNLTIFLLGAEIRPLRHLLRLVQARTLHLQRLVHADPYRDEEDSYRHRRASEENSQNETLAGIAQRVAALEGAGSGEEDRPKPTVSVPMAGATGASADIRSHVQPELDMLARALRRTHKQQTFLETRMAEQLRGVEQRLDEAVTLARTTARQQQQQQQQQMGFLDFIWSLVMGLLFTPLRLLSLLRAVVFAPFTSPSDTSSSAYRAMASKKRNGNASTAASRRGKQVTAPSSNTTLPDPAWMTPAAGGSNGNAGVASPTNGAPGSSRLYKSAMKR